MKKNYLNIIAALFAIVALSSCGGITKMKDSASEISYSVTPNPLEMKGGEVELTIQTTFPPKYFNKKAIVEATPVLVYEGGEKAFETTIVQGESVTENNKVISFEGGSYSFTGKIPYDPAMLQSALEVRMSGRIKDQPIEFGSFKIADGVISTANLVQIDPMVIMSSDNFKRIIPEEVGADILYLINQANIRGTELKAEDVTALLNAIKAASADENKEFKGISISAYASPDGAVELNDKLSKKRQESSERYLKNEMKKSKLAEAKNDSLFSSQATAEDWDGFKKLMEASSIQDKDLILRVLSMYSDPEVREKEIKNISEAFEEIKDDILPLLRRAKLAVNIDVVGYSDEELTALAKSNPDTLNLEELLYAANLISSLDEKLPIYQKAAEKYPDCFRAKNNIGCVNFLMGNIDAAKTAFEAAKALKDNDVVNNNLGACALKSGDFEGAEAILTSATGAGSQPQYGLGIIKIKKGDYKAALSYFGGKPTYNLGLAQLLNGEPDAALGTLGKVETESASLSYLKAVAGARAKKDEVVLNNLRNAVGKDASLKAYAKKDLEFKDYRATEGFTSIVE